MEREVQMTEIMDFIANEQMSSRRLAVVHAAGAAVGIAIAVAVVAFLIAP
jgi:hypothetical protein